MTQEALKLALEALEDIFGKNKVDVTVINVIKEALAQPEQEPVIDKSAAIRIATALGWTPPRTWVGLTDEEKLNIEIMGGKSDVMLAEMVEAQLKQRNT